MQNQTNTTFNFLSYYFNRQTLTATFCYQGLDNTIFTEHIIFDQPPHGSSKFNPENNPKLDELLDRALFLAYVVSGTSYYKAHPTPFVKLEVPIDDFQAAFFSRIYQEGLSQFALENNLIRNNLAHFYPTPNYSAPAPLDGYAGKGIISLQSGGKDSLLVSALLAEREIDYTPWYVSSSEDKTHPAVIDNLFDSFEAKNASICVRSLDLANLKKSQGLNGHVPITLIISALALVQAILSNDNVILTSIAQEGTELHSMIGDLPVNHQWSKTWEAEQLLTEYVNRYLSPQLHIGSPIRHMSELRVAKEFVDKCWVKYGYQFSSCNQANYGQRKNNRTLGWCGACAKCANTYLLFCPFLAPHQLQALMGGEDLFLDPQLTLTFKGLLGIDNVPQPFECIGTIEELRTAYHHRMQVPPIPVDQLSQKTGLSLNLINEETANNLSQASERLGLKKLFQKTPPATTAPAPSAGPKVVQLYQPLYADLPFPVPEGHFDYLADFPANPFFKNFFSEYSAGA